MKINAISDIHGFFPKEKIDCDLLIIAGDVCPLHNHSPRYQFVWIIEELQKWLINDCSYERCVIVPGNHDFVFQENYYLQDIKRKLVNIASTTILIDNYDIYIKYDYDKDGNTYTRTYNIWGTPWQPEFYNWAFNLKEEELAKKWELITPGTDILVCHGPPKGYGDCGLYGAGSQSLTDKILEIKPEVVFYGHIHEGYGKYQIGEHTVGYNVSLLNDKYELVNPVTRIEL